MIKLNDIPEVMEEAELPSGLLSELLANERSLATKEKMDLMYFFSPTGGFFVEPTRASFIPEDAVEITKSRYEALLGVQDGQKRIVIGPEGLPISTSLHSPTPVLIESAKKRVDSYMGSLMNTPVEFEGVTIRPESNEQASLTSLLTGAQFTGQDTFDFKFQNTWVTLSKEQLTRIVKGLHLYVQAMYTTLRSHHEALDKFVDLPQFEAQPVIDYDYTVNWPSFEDMVK